MPGEVDPRLIGVLQAVMGMSDALRDAGTRGPITVRLGREDGLRLLEVVAGASTPEAEAWSQRGRPELAGLNSLKVAHIVFEWPKGEAAGTRLRDVISGRPAGLGQGANDNARSPSAVTRFFRFEEDKPALR